MVIKVIEGSLQVEKRKGPQGSYNTNFAHIEVTEDGIKKSLHVFYNPHDGAYGLEIYQGSNYVVGSTARSYSRQYPKFKGLPEKYYKIAHFLYDKVAKRN